MEICFVGVGEACQPSLGNTSVLIRGSSRLLIDCGFGVPARLFEQPDFCEIDAVYLTHFHADHTFGVPGLLGRLGEEGRTKPLTFLGQDGIEELVRKLMDTGYPTLASRLPYPLEFIENTQHFDFQQLSLYCAESGHSQRNFAVRISDGTHVVGVSGDGPTTEATRSLFSTCEVVIHECYRYSEEIPGHGTATSLVEGLKNAASIEMLCLVHLQRDARAGELEQILALAEDAPFELLVPEPGDVLRI